MSQWPQMVAVSAVDMTIFGLIIQLFIGSTVCVHAYICTVSKSAI